MSMSERNPGPGAPDPLDDMAPCGLDCGRCLSNPGSAIARLARELRAELGGFAALAERFAGMDAAFGAYGGFERLLDRLGGGQCTGCRSGRCLLSSCGVKDCAAARGVRWCFQCPEFPCRRTNLPPALHERWRANNQRMAARGPEAFFAAMRKQPRY